MLEHPGARNIADTIHVQKNVGWLGGKLHALRSWFSEVCHSHFEQNQKHPETAASSWVSETISLLQFWRQTALHAMRLSVPLRNPCLGMYPYLTNGTPDPQRRQDSSGTPAKILAVPSTRRIQIRNIPLQIICSNQTCVFFCDPLGQPSHKNIR